MTSERLREFNRERSRKWRENHPEESREKTRLWMAAHPEVARRNARRWKLEHRELIREQDRLRRAAKRDHIRELERKRYAADSQRHREKAQRWRRANPERAKLIYQKWKNANKDKHRETVRKRYESNPMPCVIRAAINRMFSKGDCPKTSLTFQYIGCSSGFLRNHLESLFKPGMTWDNYGEWVIDHIVPLSWWDIKNHPEHLFEASHWTNLQPLWRTENQRKSNRQISIEEENHVNHS